MERALCADNGVKGYPTVKFFYQKKDGALKYSSARTIEALKTFVEEQVSKEVGFLVGVRGSHPVCQGPNIPKAQ